MAGGKKQSTASVCEELARPLLEELGLSLWDVRYEKEGSMWFLRYFIDKAGGVNIEDCEKFSRAVEAILDKADPVDGSYTLEVSSPGIERELSRTWHFEAVLGKEIYVKLIRPVEGEREFYGKLCDVQGDTLTMMLQEDIQMQLSKAEAAVIRLCDDFDNGGHE